MELKEEPKGRGGARQGAGRPRTTEKRVTVNLTERANKALFLEAGRRGTTASGAMVQILEEIASRRWGI